MSDSWIWIVFIGLWAVALLVFIPYVRNQRHPDSRPLGAYLSFVIVFTVAAYLIFAAMVAVISIWTGLPLEHWLVATLVLIVTFVPPFFLATAVIRLKPSIAPRLDDQATPVDSSGRKER